MKAYLLDPVEHTFCEVEYSGNYKDIYKLLSWEENPVSCFTCVQLNNQEDMLFVDDEGLMKNPTHWILHQKSWARFAGKGLVLGTDEEGRSVEPTVDLEWLQRNFLLINND